LAYIHNAWYDCNASVLNSNDERRGVGIGASGSVKEFGIVVWDETADNCQADHVEQSDTPEDLLHSGG
jgi:hypothetical protein